MRHVTRSNYNLQDLFNANFTRHAGIPSIENKYLDVSSVDAERLASPCGGDGPAVGEAPDPVQPLDPGQPMRDQNHAAAGGDVVER